MPGARVSLGERSAVSDYAGSFVLSVDQPGEYRLQAQREGFFTLRDYPVQLAAGDNLVTLELNRQREVLESVEVKASPPLINPEQLESTHQINATQLINIPYPQTNQLRNALPMIPGVVQDSRGSLHIAGGSSDQTFWTLDGFNITDPLTGRFETHVSVDGVQAVEVATSRYSAETGKGSAGAVQITTVMGDDKWRPSATNFFPGVEDHKGLLIGNWTPRVTVSGPLQRGRAWLSNAADARYEQNVVEELPAGQDRNTIWRLSNLLRFQVNLTPANILTASWLTYYWNAPHNGLTPLDPMETTSDRSTRQNFASVKDQMYLGGGALLEIGYAALRGWAREVPQGRAAYTFTPEGRSGNYFLESRRRSGRDQWLANLFLPAFTAAGSHQVKTGVDADRVTYYQLADRRPVEFYRSDLTLSRRVEYTGSGELRRRNFEAAAYVQDTWKPLARLVVESGVRADWDQITRRTVLSPRVSFALAPPRTEHTKITAGFGIFHDALNLRVLSRHLDQYALARYYRPDGKTLDYGPALSVYLLDDRDLRVPVYRNFSVGVEQQLPWGMHGRFEFLHKRGRDGFTFINTIVPGVTPDRTLLSAYGAAGYDGLFLLRNVRRDEYDSFEVTVRKSFRRQSEVMASYTRSRAVSNAVVDVNIDDPTLVTENEGRLPWDSPNRLVAWGFYGLSEKNALAWLFEWRDGYPFFVRDDDGRLLGSNTARRYPAYINLNLHYERKFRALGQRWAWRGGFNNAFNRLNPTVVNNDASSPNFLHFSGGQHRALVIRLRWLGKVTGGSESRR